MATRAFLRIAFLWAVLALTPDASADQPLRICADPVNPPFSMRDGSGFENRIAEILAAEMDRTVDYTWFPQATGFVRQTLLRNRCDVIMGYARPSRVVIQTRPYYVSRHVLLTMPHSPLAGVDDLANPVLAGRRIGVVAGSPPAAHLAMNGLITASRPYPLQIDRRFHAPVERMLNDLRSGALDGAVLWGPIAGPLADPNGMILTPLRDLPDRPALAYAVRLSVRAGDTALRGALDAALERAAPRIQAALQAFNVPLDPLLKR